MESPPTPDFLIGQMRVLTTRQETYFFVASPPTPFAALDSALSVLIPQLEAAQAEAHVGGPILIRFFPTDTPPVHLMEVGIRVKPGTQPAGTAQVKILPPYPCAGLLLWGSLAHIVEAYEALQKGMREAEMEHTGECEE